MNGDSVDVIKSANTLMRMVAKVKAGENVLIVADTETDMQISVALAGVAQSIGAIPTIAIMPTGDTTVFATKAVIKALEGTDVLINTPKSTHGPSKMPIVQKLRSEGKLRVICLGERGTVDTFTKGPSTADPTELYNYNQKILEIMKKGKTMRVTTRLGTDITASIDGAYDRGSITSHDFTNHFNTGEMCIVPIEDTGEGVTILDGPIGDSNIRSVLGIGHPLSQPLKLTFKKGRVVKYEGGVEASVLESYIKKFKDADNLGELAMGTNPKARRTGEAQEEKKIRGVVEVALGDGVCHGGWRESVIHLDMIVYNTTVEVDGKTIQKDGILTI